MKLQQRLSLMVLVSVTSAVAIPAFGQVNTLFQPADPFTIGPFLDSGDVLYLSQIWADNRGGVDISIFENNDKTAPFTTAGQSASSVLDGTVYPFSISASGNDLTVSVFGNSITRNVDSLDTMTSFLVEIVAKGLTPGSFTSLSNLSFQDNTLVSPDPTLNPSATIATVQPDNSGQLLGFYIENLSGIGDFTFSGDLILDNAAVTTGSALGGEKGRLAFFTKGAYIETTAVPEPGAYAALFGLLAAGWVALRRRRSL